MPPAKGKGKSKAATGSSSKKAKTGPQLAYKSPAEFFAENQNIAGFDNAGKALYTTIREFVENALDAAEAVRALPDIQLHVEELSDVSFAELRGLSGAGARVDTALYQGKQTAAERRKSITEASKAEAAEAAAAVAAGEDEDEGVTTPTGGAKGKKKKEARVDGKYYRITCTDNGCGMPYDKIPDMFGRVLSGSKYGVKQARGKFGLGAKMALIWSKKSTGLPIRVRSAYAATAKSSPPSTVTVCCLDIDIHKNEPNVHEHTKVANTDQWRGSEISVVISGNWTAYKSRIMAYMQQLAVITPYANFELKFDSQIKVKKSFTMVYARRSSQMGRLPKSVKHHPSSVDNLLVKQLLDQTKTANLVEFLRKDFSSIDKELAERLVGELAKLTKLKNIKQMSCGKLDTKTVHQLTQLLKETQAFDKPNQDCLSPAGEYNLRLGIMKEFQPTLVATSSAKASAYDGHPFMVEAAVALGGDAGNKPGLVVYRFANRIPLLFEGGSDVATVTAKQRIKWSSFKINHKTDRIAVFVSIVSTKVPFKGTGKEYIGDDVMEIRAAVQEALMLCCKQLRVKLVQRNEAKSQADRLKSLTKYVPNVVNALEGVFKAMKERQAENVKAKSNEKKNNESVGNKKKDEDGNEVEERVVKRRRIDANIVEFDRTKVAAPVLEERLLECIQKEDTMIALQQLSAKGRGHAERQNIFLPVGRASDVPAHRMNVLRGQLCTIRFTAALQA